MSDTMPELSPEILAGMKRPTPPERPPVPTTLPNIEDNPMVSVSIRLPIDTMRALEPYADTTRGGRSEVIRRAVDEYLARLQQAEHRQQAA